MTQVQSRLLTTRINRRSGFIAEFWSGVKDGIGRNGWLTSIYFHHDIKLTPALSLPTAIFTSHHYQYCLLALLQLSIVPLLNSHAWRFADPAVRLGSESITSCWLSNGGYRVHIEEALISGYKFIQVVRRGCGWRLTMDSGLGCSMDGITAALLKRQDPRRSVSTEWSQSDGTPIS